jgi:hypothetical protein
MADYTDRLKEADRNYEQLDHLFILWIHFEIKDEQIVLYYKTKTNISESDAQTILDNQYGAHMNDYWNVEGGSNPDPALRGHQKDTNARNTQGSYDCRELKDCYPTSLEQIKKWRAYCCLLPPKTLFLYPGIEINIEDNSVEALNAGVASGILDGVWETLLFIYQAGSGLKTALDHVPLTVGWFVQAYERARDEGSFYKGLVKKLQEDKSYWKNIAKFVINITQNFGLIWKGIKEAIKGIFHDLSIQSGLAKTGYAIGKIAFEVILDYFTGGAATLTKISKFSKSSFAFFKELASNPGVIKSKVIGFWGASKATATKLRCRILLGGCFVAGTSVLTAGLEQVPIENISLGTAVYSHATINQTNNLTVSATTTLYDDPFTSQNQKEVDQIDTDAEQWYQVEFALQQINGHISTAKLVRPQSWLNKHQISKTTAKVWLSMPEQGLNGYATLTSLAHFRFTKIPADDNQNDDYKLRPVTGIFEHYSNDVWHLIFDNGDTLGVTGGHPIYSLDNGDWRLAGELRIGEQVLTKEGYAKFLEKEKLDGGVTVFNLEVRDFHNFFVGNSAFLVHNSCKVSIKNLPTLTLHEDFIDVVQTAKNGFYEYSFYVKKVNGKKIFRFSDKSIIQKYEWENGFDFVILSDGTLKIGYGHGFMAGHKKKGQYVEIKGAGKLIIDKKTGELIKVTKQSGHFQPDDIEIRLIEDRLIEEGFF